MSDTNHKYKGHGDALDIALGEQSRLYAEGQRYLRSWKEAERERDTLAEALREAVEAFRYPCHPGEAAFKAMTSVATVERWRATLAKVGAK